MVGFLPSERLDLIDSTDLVSLTPLFRRSSSTNLVSFDGFRAGFRRVGSVFIEAIRPMTASTFSNDFAMLSSILAQWIFMMADTFCGAILLSMDERVSVVKNPRFSEDAVIYFLISSRKAVAATRFGKERDLMFMKFVVFSAALMYAGRALCG